MTDNTILDQSNLITPIPKRPPRRPYAAWVAWMERYDPEGLAKIRSLDQEGNRRYRQRVKERWKTQPHTKTLVQEYERRKQSAR